MARKQCFFSYGRVFCQSISTTSCVFINQGLAVTCVDFPPKGGERIHCATGICLTCLCTLGGGHLLKLVKGPPLKGGKKFHKVCPVFRSKFKKGVDRHFWSYIPLNYYWLLCWGPWATQSSSMQSNNSKTIWWTGCDLHIHHNITFPNTSWFPKDAFSKSVFLLSKNSDTKGRSLFCRAALWKHSPGNWSNESYSLHCICPVLWYTHVFHSPSYMAWAVMMLSPA